MLQVHSGAEKPSEEKASVWGKDRKSRCGSLESTVKQGSLRRPHWNGDLQGDRVALKTHGRQWSRQKDKHVYRSCDWQMPSVSEDNSWSRGEGQWRRRGQGARGSSQWKLEVEKRRVELPTFFGEIFMTNFLEVDLNLMQLADWTQSRVCLALPLTTDSFNLPGCSVTHFKPSPILIPGSL